MGRIGRIRHIGLIKTLMMLGAFCLLAGCGGRAWGPFAGAQGDSSDVAETDTIPAEHDVTMDAKAWADSIMDCMTLEELAGQLIMPAVYSDDSSQAMQLVRKYATDSHVGGVVLLKGTADAASVIADTLRRLLPAPPFIAIDAEWGLAMRLQDTPEFPHNGRISQEADETLLFDYGNEVARECRVVGINMVLGPVLDVLPTGRRMSGIGSRSFGKDPKRAARLGVAYAKGIEAGGVISVAKHFPGHGSADADSHKRLPVVAKTREELEASDLLPFREYVGNGLSAIMTGHLYVPALDENEEPVTVSDHILKGFLRSDLEFHGLIITDAMNMAGADGNTAADAIMAGADIVIAPANTEEELKILADAVRDGRFSLQQLRDRVGRVLFYKYLVARNQRSEVRGQRSDVRGQRSEEAERIKQALIGETPPQPSPQGEGVLNSEL